MPSCQVCFEKKGERSVITCFAEGCHYVTCIPCLKMYYDNNTFPEPRCPSCSVEWRREFLCNFNKAFYTQYYKQMRERFLLEQEKARFPETMQIIERKRIMRERFKKMKDDRRSLFEAIQNLDRHMERLQYALETNRLDEYQDEDEDQDHRNPKAVQPCPEEGCRGFIMNRKWACAICNVKICNECFVKIEDKKDHVCKDEDKATADLIKKSSKPCPKCMAPIHKIDGCNQMWCVMCQTAFSYQSGKIVTGRVHNPHYYEWQRQANGGVAPRVEGDHPCDNERMPWHELEDYMRGDALNFTHCVKIMKMHMFVGHVLYEFREPQRTDNFMLRENFILGHIDEKTFKIEVQKRDKKFLKDTELHNIAETLEQASETVFRKIREASNAKSKRLFDSELEIFEKELDDILTFLNECFESVHKKFGGKKIIFRYRNEILRRRDGSIISANLNVPGFGHVNSEMSFMYEILRF